MHSKFTDFNDSASGKVATGILKIMVNPEDPIFDNISIKTGDTVKGKQNLTVKNTGNIKYRYWIIAEWAPVPPTTMAQALEIINLLHVAINKITAPKVNIYTGSLANLFDKPVKGRLLAPSKEEELEFILSLPAQPMQTKLNPQISVNILFVAEQL